MNQPDLLVAALTVRVQLVGAVALAGRRRPNLDDQRQWLVENLQLTWMLSPPALDQVARQDAEIGNEVTFARDAHTRLRCVDGVAITIDLVVELLSRLTDRALMLRRHRRLLPQLPADQLPTAMRILQRHTLISLCADAHLRPLFEQLRQLDAHTRQRDQIDRIVAAEQYLNIGAVWLAAPGAQPALVGVD